MVFWPFIYSHNNYVTGPEKTSLIYTKCTSGMISIMKAKEALAFLQVISMCLLKFKFLFRIIKTNIFCFRDMCKCVIIKLVLGGCRR